MTLIDLVFILVFSYCGVSVSLFAACWPLIRRDFHGRSLRWSVWAIAVWTLTWPRSTLVWLRQRAGGR